MKLNIGNFKGSAVFEYRITHDVRKNETGSVDVFLALEIKTPFDTRWRYTDTVLGTNYEGDVGQAAAMAVARAEKEWNLNLIKEEIAA